MTSFEILHNIYIWVIWILILGSIFFYFFQKKLYLNYRIFIRKLYYGLIFSFGFLLYIENVFPVNTLAELSILMVIIVVVDLSIFQTPDITKFMSQEFKHQEIEQTFHENEDLVIHFGLKLNNVNQIITELKEVSPADNIKWTRLAYEELLTSYLSSFGGNFKMKIFPYYIESSEDNEEFKSKIEEAYTKIKGTFNFGLKSVGMRKRSVINRLEDGNSIIIIDKENSYAIVPYFPKNISYNYLIALTSENEYTILNETDAALITNMLFTLETWLEPVINNDQPDNY